MAIARRRGGRGKYARLPELQQNTDGLVRAIRKLPEYLERGEVGALIRCAPNPSAALLMLEQWRAGLRISEALALELRDLYLDPEQPTLRVRPEAAKGGRERRVPLHPELRAALYLASGSLASNRARGGPIITVNRSTGWRWVRQAYGRAIELGAIPAGRKIGTHTLRHSFARHALASGIPINVLSRWLGHASILTTLIYLEILPDPLGHIERME